MKKFATQEKIFGWLNLFDLAVILVIALIGVKVIHDYKPVSPQIKDCPVNIGMLVRNVPPYVADSLTVGQDLFEDRFDAYLGKIRSMHTEPAEIMLSHNGRMVLFRSPRNLDIRLDITRSNGRIEKGPARSGVYLGKIAVRVGARFRAHTRYTAIRGEITYIKVNKL